MISTKGRYALRLMINLAVYSNGDYRLENGTQYIYQSLVDELPN